MRQKARSTPEGSHVPVMLAEVLDRLRPGPGEVAVDCTLGAAGHAAALLRAIGPTGQLLAFDLDPANIAAAHEKLSPIGSNFELHHANFAAVESVLAGRQLQANLLLADLGMSSMQVDDPERGFSFSRDGPLDMRMDQTRGRSAADLLASLPQQELAAAFRDLGDEPQAEAIAAAVVARRKNAPIRRTRELADLILQAAPVRIERGPGKPTARQQEIRPTARVFQALRILVNRELASLDALLRALPRCLAPGGRAAVISFHSGEDRIVKSAFRDGLRSGIYSAASDEPIRAGDSERYANPRSRSAKLRWAVRAMVPDSEL